MQSVLFPLNDTVLVVLDVQTKAHRVVQVTVKAERADQGCIDTITTYYLVRHTLSDLILRMVTAHITNGLPEELVLEDPRYTIRVHRTEWRFGHKVHFQWGEEELGACEDKWTFWFEVKPLGQSKSVER